MKQLFDVANWFAQVEMLWWVSSTALIGSLLAGCWLKRDELAREERRRARSGRGRRWSRWAYWVGVVFLLTVVLYGALTTWVGFRLGAAGLDACDAAVRSGCTRGGEGVVFYGLPWAVLVGTSSFVIALISWIVAWRGFLSTTAES